MLNDDDELLEAEARLARYHVVQAVAGLATIGGLCVLALASTVGAVSGLVLVLRGPIGLGPALILVGLVTTGLASALGWSIYARLVGHDRSSGTDSSNEGVPHDNGVPAQRV